MITGAPIRTGEASPLRVATGGEASLGSKALAAARPPVRIHGAADVLGWRKADRPQPCRSLQPSSPLTDVASNGSLSAHAALRRVQKDESLEKRLL